MWWWPAHTCHMRTKCYPGNRTRQPPLRPLYQQPPQLVVPHFCNAYIWHWDQAKVYWRYHCTCRGNWLQCSWYLWGRLHIGLLPDFLNKFMPGPETIILVLPMETFDFHADFPLHKFLVQLFQRWPPGRLHTELTKGKMCITPETAPPAQWWIEGNWNGNLSEHWFSPQTHCCSHHSQSNSTPGILVHGLYEVEQSLFAALIPHSPPGNTCGDPVKGLLQIHECHVEWFLCRQVFLVQLSHNKYRICSE